MAAIELAVKFEILQAQKDQFAQTIYQCFSDFMERYGHHANSYEDNRIEQLARDFIQLHEHEFIYPCSLSLIPHSFPGYIVRNHHWEEDHYYIFPAIFKSEICKGFDEEKVKRVLYELDWLSKKK